MGVINLKTGELLPHDRRLGLSHFIDIKYNPDANCPKFMQFLNDICLGRPELGEFLQVWLGYCLTGEVSEQKFLNQYGMGANGKSVLTEVIQSVMGSLAGNAPSTLVLGAKDDDKQLNANTALLGRRLVVVKDTERDTLKEGAIKNITGDETLQARFLYQERFTFSPTHKVVLHTNNLPTIRSQDRGIWRRVLVMPFEATFGSKEEVKIGTATHGMDKNIKHKLLQEREGILLWMVQGAIKWYEKGLRIPDIVKAASGEYRNSQDRMGEFVSDCCELDSTSVEAISTLYSTYKCWSVESGYKPLGKRQFINELKTIRGEIYTTNKTVRVNGTPSKPIYGIKVLNID